MVRSFDGKKPTIAASAFVSEAAYVIGDVSVGENSSIWPGAVIRGDTCRIMIGSRSSIEDNCVVHGSAEIFIGNDVIIGHGAIVHGHKIGNNVLVGNNATILDGAELGDFCIIGAGGVVPPEVKIPQNALALGTPVQVKCQLSQKQREELIEGTAFYTSLAREYKRQGL
jgi:carbonic anhydrase/acetyltransferase-like protein (isoleucine patch superfamily)